MAIQSYDDLGVAIQEWLSEDTNLATRWPDMVVMCESELNYGREALPGRPKIPPLRVLDMQSAKQVTLNPDDSDGGENVSLPDDYLEMRALTETTNPNRGALEYLTPDEFYTKQVEGPWNEIRFYTIVGRNIRLLDPPTADTQKLEMNYYQKIPALSASVQTNWLILAHPMLYLYGSLIHAASYFDAAPATQQQAAYWQKLYDDARAGVIDSDRRAQSTMAPRKMRKPAAVTAF